MKRPYPLSYRCLFGGALVTWLMCAAAAIAEVEMIRLVWTHDPATTMTVGWCQKSGDPVGVRYGTGSELNQEQNAITSREYNSKPGPGVNAPITSHFVTLTGLNPDTAYSFAIQDSEGTGETMWFKTAPDKPAPITFVAGGDSRTNREPRQVGNILVSKIRPLFVAHGGDYQNKCTNQEMREWLDEWQLTKSSDGRMYPLIPAHGNHENDVVDFCRRMFNIKNPDAYFALNVAGNMLRLYTLNTELEKGVGYGSFSSYNDGSQWNAQKKWLTTDLSRHKDSVKWLVANYHRPMRPHTSGKTEGTGRIAAWANAFFDNGLDLAIECDSHMAKLTYPIRPFTGPGSFESFIRDDESGTVFIGEGSWGAPTRPNNDDKPWTLASGSFWQFNLIHVSPESLAVRKVVIGRDNELVDPATVTELTQEAQDAEPLALPAGLPLWQSSVGDVFTLPFAFTSQQ